MLVEGWRKRGLSTCRRSKGQLNNEVDEHPAALEGDGEAKLPGSTAGSSCPGFQTEAEDPDITGMHFNLTRQQRAVHG